MKFFKIITLSILMLTWSQSNAMEVVWERGSWTEQDINRIVKLSDEEVIQYWKAFWSQIKPGDIFDQVKDSFDIRSYGDCKDDFYGLIAENFDIRLRYCNFHNKNRWQLGKEVLSGYFRKNNMFMDIADIPKELKVKSVSSEETVSSNISDEVEDSSGEEPQEQPVLSNGPQNPFDSDDSFSESDSDSIPQQWDTSGPTLGGVPQNLHHEDGIFTTTLNNMRANPLPTFAGVMVVGGICYWAYKKYQAYKATQKESGQVEQSENETTETDKTV